MKTLLITSSIIAMLSGTAIAADAVTRADFDPLENRIKHLDPQKMTISELRDERKWIESQLKEIKKRATVRNPRYKRLRRDLRQINRTMTAFQQPPNRQVLR